MRPMDRSFWDSPTTRGVATLTGHEAHHLIHVMRGRLGTRVVLFDGSGCEFQAVVEGVGHGEVQLSIVDRQEVDRELPVHLTLAVALPKGDRQRWLVEKAVELGVERLVPLGTLRSVAQPVVQALARLQRNVIEASKQCGRNRLMQIAQPQNWPDLVATTGHIPTRILAHPESQTGATEARGSAQPLPAARPADPVLLAVGPEGGFSTEEVALAVAAGWRAVDLGPRILRVETAALVLAAIVAQHTAVGIPSDLTRGHNRASHHNKED